MAIDKFATHISKRYKINDIDIKDLVKKVEKEVSDNISNNLNYIENEVVDHFKYELQTQNKRFLENVENVMKKLKFSEEQLTT